MKNKVREIVGELIKQPYVLSLYQGFGRKRNMVNFYAYTALLTKWREMENDGQRQSFI